MKSMTWSLAILLMGLAASLPAAKAGSLAAGIQVGGLTGVDLKLWLSKTHAVEVAFGTESGNPLVLQGTYIWHRYGIFHSERENLEDQLPLYIGAGGILAGSADGPYGLVPGFSAVRIALGASYLFPQEPFDVFLEVSPTLYIVPVGSFAMHAALGGRIYF